MGPKTKILVLLGITILFAGGFFLLNQNSEPQPTPNPQSQEKDKGSLSIESIENMEYYDSECAAQVKLQAGVFEQEKYTCKGEVLPGFSLRTWSKIALGDLTHDGKDEAAVILSTNYGGSGDFRKLVIIQNQDGDNVQVASYDLGDRVIINSISIRNSRIVLEMVVHAPEDGACCPTQETLVEYELRNNELYRI